MLLRCWTASLPALGTQERCRRFVLAWRKWQHRSTLENQLALVSLMWHWPHSTSILKKVKNSTSKTAKLNPSNYCSSDSVSNLNLPNFHVYCSGPKRRDNTGDVVNEQLQPLRLSEFQFCVCTVVTVVVMSR